MLPEQLLQPRYKVIADMPFKPSHHMYNIGDILTDNGKTAVLDQNGDPVFPCEWEKYPHLFKPLEWWEERTVEELPGYLRVFITDFIKFTKGQIIRVEKHKSNSFNQIVPSLFISKDKQGPPPHPDCFCYKDFLPATETEYNAYLNTK